MVEESHEGVMTVTLQELVLFGVKRRRMTVYEDEYHVETLMYSCKIK